MCTIGSRIAPVGGFLLPLLAAAAPAAPQPESVAAPAVRPANQVAEALPTSGSPESEAAPPVEFADLLARARATQRRDLEAWHRYTFKRQVVRESLRADGRTSRREELTFRLTPTESGFDEHLLLVDGVEPGSRLVARHRKAARFSERYRSALGSEDSGGAADAARNAVLRTPLSGTVLDGGSDKVDGVACRRLVLVADGNVGDGSLANRIAAVTEGTVWVSMNGLHIVRAETRLAAPVSVFGFLGKLVRLDIAVESAPDAAGVWLPRRIQVTSGARVAGFPTRKRNAFTYSEYERFPAAGPDPQP